MSGVLEQDTDLLQQRRLVCIDLRVLQRWEMRIERQSALSGGALDWIKVGFQYL